MALVNINSLDVKRCFNPIVPLSTEKEALLAAINSMIINVGSYKPYTYIPAS
ncbi:hypothetical protein [Pseudaminobacter sp. NGMCC 1.201702]|uniref:hypothetical protein n=1 Tax=Pseudaminobacter sp. NGMCC 1.201702 TaxID=3391825 RepID=UPI0039EF2D7D